jgi:fructokinase
MQLAHVVGLGEILWDIFPDATRFGGAPANFACMAASLDPAGCRAHMAGAVGRDALGQQALLRLRELGVDVTSVSQPDFATGQVQVQVDAAGLPSYRFEPNAAWDHFDWSDKLERLARMTDVVCFGTLGQRSEMSRTTIQRFLSTAPPSALRIFDVNLRTPFWTDHVVLESLRLANVVKLNDTELPVLAELASVGGQSERDLLQHLLDEHQLRCIALTRGADGSTVLSAASGFDEQRSRPTSVVDTVGAGDSFTAALALGLQRGLPLDETHRWASRVAAFVCSQRGATPRLPEALRWDRLA